MNTVSARQIQREYKKVLEQANKVNEPIIVMANNKPLGAVIGLDLLEKIQLDTVLKEAMAEYKAGKTVAIKTDADLESHFVEMDEMINEK
jgi:prevent-host-death family protein